MNNYDCRYWPKRILQGTGASLKLSDLIPCNEMNRCLFFTDNKLIGLDHTNGVISSLKNDGIEVFVYTDIEENPKDYSIYPAVDYMKKVKPDFLVYYGGGSVIDFGKAANLLYTHKGIINDYEDLKGGLSKIKDIMLFSFAIATTAGSGSEVSSVSVITDTNKNAKIGVLSPNIIPNVSVLDPLPTTSLPPDLTAYTGIDALVHCVEAYVSSVQFEIGKGIAIQGIDIILSSILKAFNNSNDLESRMKMLIGSACGAMAFNNNYLGAVHGCAHQLSSLAGIPHGLANAIMLLPVIEWNAEVYPERYISISNAFGITASTISISETIKSLIKEIRELETKLEIPSKLSYLGVDEKIIDKMVENAFNDHNMLTNPRKSKECPERISKEIIKQLYLSVY